VIVVDDASIRSEYSTLGGASVPPEITETRRYTGPESLGFAATAGSEREDASDA
jgi:hypothetical protein